MSQTEEPHPLRTWELRDKSGGCKWPKVADAVIEAYLLMVLSRATEDAITLCASTGLLQTTWHYGIPAPCGASGLGARYDRRSEGPFEQER
jgi:hypothetical protein